LSIRTLIILPYESRDSPSRPADQKDPSTKCESGMRVYHRVANEVRALVGDALGAQVLDRLMGVREQVARELNGAIWLISSGIVQSKERTPDSRWAGRTPRG
jgi:hypothetical protein